MLEPSLDLFTQRGCGGEVLLRPPHFLGLLHRRHAPRNPSCAARTCGKLAQRHRTRRRTSVCTCHHSATTTICGYGCGRYPAKRLWRVARAIRSTTCRDGDDGTQAWTWRCEANRVRNQWRRACRDVLRIHEIEGRRAAWAVRLRLRKTVRHPTTCTHAHPGRKRLHRSSAIRDRENVDDCRGKLPADRRENEGVSAPSLAAERES